MIRKSEDGKEIIVDFNKVLKIKDCTNMKLNLSKKRIYISAADAIVRDIEFASKFKNFFTSFYEIKSAIDDKSIKTREDLMEIINDYIELELHNNISCINKAFVSRKSLRKAMRNDLDKLIKFAINDNNMDLELVLVHIRQANLLYEFEKLKSLFVESIILTQLFSYDENFIIYSPADLKWIA